MTESNEAEALRRVVEKEAVGSPGASRRDGASIRSRLEQWAMNPRCPANEISVILGVPMREVALAEGLVPTTGQSRFALAAGNRFERSLFADNAELLRAELVRKEVLPEGARGFLDLRIVRSGGPLHSQEEAIRATKEVLLQAAGRAEDTPSIVASAAIRLPGMPLLPEAVLVLDALVIQTNYSPARLVVTEVKTYPDRGGFTNPISLAGARAQAGAYVHGLSVLVEQLGVTAMLEVSKRGILILTRPGRYYPSVRATEDLEFQAARASRGLARLQALADDMVGRPCDDPVRCVLEAKTMYAPTCPAFCDRARGCYQRALLQGDPAALGEEAKAFLGTINLDRAVELLGGAEPRNVAEKDLLDRLQKVERTCR